MKSIITLGIAAFLFLQATGLDVVVAPQACASACPGDEPDGNCAPFCEDCYCCPTLRSCVQPDSAFVSPLVPKMALEPEMEPLPPRPAPADIFHIPKTALA